jgi:adenylate cyclase
MNDLATRRVATAAAAVFRVLVVDDDPDMAGFLARLITKQGLQADIAHDGHVALDMIAASPPDMVLLDVQMPGPDGFEICRRLKGNDATALLPVVLVTALEDQDSRVRGIEAGADDFLSKPVRREELLARVATLRRLHDTRKELEGRRLAAEVQEKEAIRKTFSRYLSPRLAERVLAQGPRGEDVFRNLSHRTAVVALFADLRGFTRLSETVPVSSIVPMLNEFFTELTAAAHDNEGTVFSMAGDSLLVGFNVPFPQADAAARAWGTARDMLASFASVHARWTAAGGMATGLGIGIAAGEAILGNIGSPHYMSYTIIGDAVNTASRLVQAARPGEILVSGPVYESIRNMVPAGAVKSQGDVPLRGKSGTTSVWSIRL